MEKIFGRIFEILQKKLAKNPLKWKLINQVDSKILVSKVQISFVIQQQFDLRKVEK